MRQLLIFVVFVLHPISTFAQLQGANWIFGDSIGINFSQVNPTYYQSSINSTECSASISDNNGNLLLYAGAGNDGLGNGYFYLSLWNKFHQKIIGGDSLFGQSSVTQGCTILQSPSDTNEYYVFHINNIPFNSGGVLYCTKVNVNFNGGNGSVIF